jgi:serine/threonine protein kinase
MKTIKKCINKNKKTKKNNISLLKKNVISKQKDIYTYKLNCKKGKIIGLKTLDIKNNSDLYEAIHVIKGKLKDYKNEIVIKVYESDSYFLQKELSIYNMLKIVHFENYINPICVFSCNDDINKYNEHIKTNIVPCDNSRENIYTFLVLDFIKYGDMSNFVKRNNIIERKVVKSIYIQLSLMISDLIKNKNIIHGDLNSGNILIRKTQNKKKVYHLFERNYEVEIYGYEPVLIDFGRSSIIKTVDEYIVIEEVSQAMATTIRYNTKKYKKMNDFLLNKYLHLLTFDNFIKQLINIVNDIL